MGSVLSTVVRVNEVVLDMHVRIFNFKDDRTAWIEYMALLDHI